MKLVAFVLLFNVCSVLCGGSPWWPFGNEEKKLEAEEQEHVAEAVDSIAEGLECSPDERKKMCDSLIASRNKAKADEEKRTHQVKVGLFLNTISAVSLGANLLPGDAPDAPDADIPDAPDAPDVDVPDADIPDAPEAPDVDVPDAPDGDEALDQAQDNFNEAQDRLEEAQKAFDKDQINVLDPAQHDAVAIHQQLESGPELQEAQEAFNKAQDALDVAQDQAELPVDVAEKGLDAAQDKAADAVEAFHKAQEALGNKADLELSDKVHETFVQMQEAQHQVEQAQEMLDHAQDASEAAEKAQEAAEAAQQAQEAKEAAEAAKEAKEAVEAAKEAQEAAAQAAAEHADKVVASAVGALAVGAQGLKTKLDDALAKEGNAGAILDPAKVNPKCLNQRKEEFEKADKNVKKAEKVLGASKTVALGLGALGIGCLAVSIGGTALTAGAGAFVFGPLGAFCGTHILPAAALGVGLSKTAATAASAKMNMDQKELMEHEIADSCGIELEISQSVTDTEDPTQVCETKVGSCMNWNRKCADYRGKMDVEVYCSRWGGGTCYCMEGYCSAYGKCVKKKEAAEEVKEDEAKDEKIIDTAEIKEEIKEEKAKNHPQTVKYSDWLQDSRGCWCPKSESTVEWKESAGWTKDSWGCLCPKAQWQYSNGWRRDAQGCMCQKGQSDDDDGSFDTENFDPRQHLYGWNQVSASCWCFGLAWEWKDHGWYYDHWMLTDDAFCYDRVPYQGWNRDSQGRWYLDPKVTDQPCPAQVLPSKDGWTRDAKGCVCEEGTADSADVARQTFDPRKHLYGWTQVSPSCWCFGLAWEWQDKGWYYDHWDRKENALYYDDVPYQGWKRDEKGNWYEI
eukprot:TRINITY_DN24392_c0_g2_i1.p1 TRINITY_DN24392_c0_g2~~TRINITY_DN24392_c0_g2_i1.p1  ORF type:complete len:851 (-),score=174.32 TRINITY_DN24392_c0_g2_i1:550-3102(-)